MERVEGHMPTSDTSEQFDELLSGSSHGDNLSMSIEPKLDMEFATDEAAYEFYNNYAFHEGFSVRKDQVRRNSARVITFRSFCCYKEGHRDKTPEDAPPPKYRKTDVRTGCEAHMEIKLCEKGVYKVISFEPIHNHEKATPKKRNLLRSHRQMSEAQKSLASVANIVGLTPKQAYDLMAKQVGGRRFLNFLPSDHKDHLKSNRKSRMALGDAGAVITYFNNRVKEDQSFCFETDKDEDNEITNIFWADSRSLSDFEIFGDVVCFDTTYKTNTYGRPFAPIVGVNHHKETVIFGSALRYDETISSFSWLFETFTKAVKGKTPKVILTDQDAAMSAAIKKVWPNTTHRLCVWHMYQNAAKHLSHIFSGSKTFEHDFSYCVYDCEDEDEFLNAWESMLVKYSLTDNQWLNNLFKNREKWALVYGRQVFCADMKSTQRSESINSTIKRYLDSKKNLLDFFDHYDRLLEDRRHTELVSDFYASQGTIVTQFHGLQKQAASIYTPTVYKVFAKEYDLFLNCKIFYCGENGTTRYYKVVTEYKNSTRERSVEYDVSSENVTCSCLKFEFMGVQCGHVLKVLDYMNIKELPDKYYLKRWRKDAKAGVELSSPNAMASLSSQVIAMNRYSSLMRIFTPILSRASLCEAASEYGHKLALDFKAKVDALVDEANEEALPDSCERQEDEVIVESSITPRGIKKRDGGRGTRRYRSSLEQSQSNKRNKGKNKRVQEETNCDSDRSSVMSMPTFPPLFMPNESIPGSLTLGPASQLLNAMHSLGRGPFADF